MEVVGRVVDIDLCVADALVDQGIVEKVDIQWAVRTDLKAGHTPFVAALVEDTPFVAALVVAHPSDLADWVLRMNWVQGLVD
jgi:hypothetical protein